MKDRTGDAARESSTMDCGARAMSLPVRLRDREDSPARTTTGDGAPAHGAAGMLPCVQRQSTTRPSTASVLRPGERGDGSGSYLRILCRLHAGDAYRTDNATVDDQGQPAIQRHQVVHAEQAQTEAARRHRILEELAGPAEIHRRLGLGLRYRYAAVLGLVERRVEHASSACMASSGRG